MKTRQKVLGCLLGGAIGDSLGYSVEFMSLKQIKDKFGSKGISELVCDNISHKALISDDTQMTLFTAEGILRGQTREKEKANYDYKSTVHTAYLRWLLTQGYPKMSNYKWIYDGYLIKIKDLYSTRIPDNSCLSALASGKIGTIDKKINNSKNCDCVTRMSPVGLFFDKQEAFKLATEFASITHGNPTAYLAAGTYAYIIAAIIEGQRVDKAILEAINELKKHKQSRGCYKTLSKAIEIAHSDVQFEKAIPLIGRGWLADEALGIAIYCSIRFQDYYEGGIRTAVNHDGDSSSTGTITGSILGARLGVTNIPEKWMEVIELKEIIEDIADDLIKKYESSEERLLKYPSY